MLNRDGFHLEQQGPAVALDYRFPALEGSAKFAFVYSHRDARVCEGRAVVMLNINADPFLLHGRLSADQARLLAANLLLAADHADLVQAAVDASAAKPKAVAL